METRHFSATEAGQRLDKALVSFLPDYSRSQIQEMIEAGQVLVDGKTAKASHKLKGSENIEVTLIEAEKYTVKPEALPLTIVYEDEDIVVIDKDAGMVVHPGIAQESSTLVHALLARYPELAKMADDEDTSGRMGIVHRLDKETSGLMVVARNRRALDNLKAQFKARTTEKIYTAMLEKHPKTAIGVIDAPIGRDPMQRKKMTVLRDGKPATTEFEVIDTNLLEGRVLAKLTIRTGRTHQIRVHMAFIKCPIVGDLIYGYRKQRYSMKRNFLHASELAFDHPRTGERMRFTSELPPSLKFTIDKLRQRRPDEEGFIGENDHSGDV
jgi:23S rRNA pseudouridine1911/1915/1917 synthase